jgi:hypothetical protein
MFGNLAHIEEEIFSLGKSITMEKNQSISVKGDHCQRIVFLPKNTKLSVDNRAVDLKDGMYFNVKEFFEKQSMAHDVITLHKTRAIVIDAKVLETKFEVMQQYKLFFLMKLSKQAAVFQSNFE